MPGTDKDDSYKRFRKWRTDQLFLKEKYKVNHSLIESKFAKDEDSLFEGAKRYKEFNKSITFDQIQTSVVPKSDFYKSFEIVPLSLPYGGLIFLIDELEVLIEGINNDNDKSKFKVFIDFLKEEYSKPARDLQLVDIIARTTNFVNSLANGDLLSPFMLFSSTLKVKFENLSYAEGLYFSSSKQAIKKNLATLIETIKNKHSNLTANLNQSGVIVPQQVSGMPKPNASVVENKSILDFFYEEYKALLDKPQTYDSKIGSLLTKIEEDTDLLHQLQTKKAVFELEKDKIDSNAKIVAKLKEVIQSEKSTYCSTILKKHTEACGLLATEYKTDARIAQLNETLSEEQSSDVSKKIISIMPEGLKPFAKSLLIVESLDQQNRNAIEKLCDEYITRCSHKISQEKSKFEKHCATFLSNRTEAFKSTLLETSSQDLVRSIVPLATQHEALLNSEKQISYLGKFISVAISLSNSNKQLLASMKLNAVTLRTQVNKFNDTFLKRLCHFFSRKTSRNLEAELNKTEEFINRYEVNIASLREEIIKKITQLAGSPVMELIKDKMEKTLNEALVLDPSLDSSQKKGEDPEPASHVICKTLNLI